MAITLGKRGAVLVSGDGPPMAVPAPAAHATDSCGAGDRFASAAAEMLADGALPAEAVSDAVIAASAFVADGGAASVQLGKRPVTPFLTDNKTAPAQSIIARTRAQGGTVVATGGCFDLLHAGHVRFLKHARALGDCLIVCLNDDASVYYIVKVTSRRPADREGFKDAPLFSSPYTQVAQIDFQDALREYNSRVGKAYAVKWNEVAAHELGPMEEE